MKLCVIGNSHVAMLMAALRDAAPADMDITWFAKPGLAEGEAVLDGSRLCARDPDLVTRLERLGTPEYVDLAAFDGVVFVGSTASAFAAVRLLQGHRVSGWPSARKMISGALTPFAAPLKHPMLSEPAYLAALTDLIRGNLTYKLATALRAASAVPICVIPQPFPSDRLFDGDKKYPMFRRVVRRGDAAALAACLRSAHARAFAGIPGLVAFDQPADTIAQDFLTAAAYTRDAVRLSQTDTLPRDDVLHAGPALGARYLDSLRAALPTL
ncbi:hypothetical protein M4578_14335 [Salipiger sp. P9]|uniref:hypothetical protein n=1 Tax=Salipiger pentaromativorans TaxID=2943193 RepID=UPI0021574F16|nr:hypothetical protein [Salipiger pentaromativorans]MCR8549013.1 hypothetical protein [Salipiger pentaromativorans]